MAEITIVIINWNTNEETIDALKSIGKQRFNNFDVMLIDNGSTPENKRSLQSLLKTVRLPMTYVDIEKNTGFTGAANTGLSRVKSPYALLLNNDTLIKDENWLSELMAPMKDPKVALAASKVLYYDGINNDTIQYAGGHLSVFGLAQHEGMGQKDGPQHDTQRQVFWAMGASVLLRMDVLRSMPEQICPVYFTYGEELDLCWRLNNLGYKIMYCPGSVIYHKGSISIKKNRAASSADRFSMRNKYLTFSRNLPAWQAALVFPLVIGFDLLRCVKRGPGFFVQFVGALREFVALYPKVRKYGNGSIRQLTFW